MNLFRKMACKRSPDHDLIRQDGISTLGRLAMNHVR
jgi:hypothetical protein